MKSLKTIKFFFFGLVFLFLLERVYRLQTDGFNINKTYRDSHYEMEDHLPAPSKEKLDEINQILNQSFTFLGSGKQCYAFLSQDKTTVLKIFKHYHFGPNSHFLTALPLPKMIKKKILLDRERRTRHIFKSSLLAYEYLQDETGLFYLHLKKTKEWHPQIQIYDKLGKKHLLLLDEMEFILQKKAELALPHLKQLLLKGDLEGAKRALTSLKNLIYYRSKKGFKNKDGSLEKNYGFIGDQAVELDVGSFMKRKTNFFSEKEQMKISNKLKSWMKNHFPEHLELIDETDL